MTLEIAVSNSRINAKHNVHIIGKETDLNRRYNIPRRQRALTLGKEHHHKRRSTPEHRNKDTDRNRKNETQEERNPCMEKERRETAGERVPMVGMVVTISPSFSLYRMVVLPAASRPTIRIRISRLEKSFWKSLVNVSPMTGSNEEYPAHGDC